VLIGITGDNQRLIDLAAITLGFGLLTTDAAQRFYARSAGGMRSQRAEFRLGALSVQDMCFLLAMQLHARGLSRREVRRVTGGLQPNQAAFVRDDAAWLEQLDPPLAAQLKLPSKERWPAPLDVETLTGPLVDPRRKQSAEDQVTGSGVFEQDSDDEVDEDEAEREPSEVRRDIDQGTRGANRGKPVFRIERSGAMRMAKLLGLPIMLLGMLFSRGEMGIEVPMEIAMPVALGLAIVGMIVGSFFTDRRCSEPKCGTALSVEDQVCPFCGGVVMGVIHHPKERLGAEEDLVRAGKVTAEGLVAGGDDRAAT
jgi:hypothetical protein